jgi:hypothetical protein
MGACIRKRIRLEIEITFNTRLSAGGNLKITFNSIRKNNDPKIIK